MRTNSPPPSWSGRTLLVFGLVLSSLLAGCRQPKGDLAGRKIDVVTTTTMVTDLVRQVGGERVAVSGLMPAGVDPHLYEPSAGDVDRLGRADLIVYNGLHLEGQMGEVFERMRERVKTVAVSDGVPRERLRSVPGFEGSYDPHVWFDVSLWMKAVEHVRDQLSELDPGSREVYHANAARYLEELQALDAEVRAELAKVPPERRLLVTAHDAFGYFGEAYGFEVHGLQGVSTESEASIADRQELARFIAERKVPAIFVETSVNVKNLQAVQEAAEALGARVRVMRGEEEQLYSDSLGDPGTPAGTYVGMVRHNVRNIVKALGPS